VVWGSGLVASAEPEPSSPVVPPPVEGPFDPIRRENGIEYLSDRAPLTNHHRL